MSTYYTSKYSGEQIDEAVKKIMDGEMTGDYADRQLSNLDTPQAALANLGAGVRPNLLDNGDFRAGHVVNQRNISSVSTAGNYLIDRWKLYASGTGSLVSKGVHLQNVVDFGTQIELARLETGKTYTFSIYTADGKCGWVTHAFEGNVSESYVTVLGDTGITLNAIYNWGNGSTNLVAFQGTAVLSYAKVEEGDTQTLAYQDSTGAWQLLPQPESDYATQLVKCQRYLLMGPINAPVWCLGYAFLPTPVTIRANPAIIGKPAINSVESNTAYPDAIAAAIGIVNNGVLFSLQNVTETCYLHFPAGSGISCEL